MDAIEWVYREEYGRVVASLVRRFGDIDVAEEAAGEALLAALERWPQDGLPPNPAGWLTRTAANKAVDAHIPYRVPAAEDLGDRVAAVLAVIYLVFNEGYLATSGSPVRDDLAAEAIRLARILRGLLPGMPEVTGLLTLMLLTQARRASRIVNGELVPLPEQDRGGWDRTLIAEGHALVRECLMTNRPGRYQLLAAINAVHTDAPAAADTDWSQIAALYGQLLALDASPVVELNYAIAIAELDGPEVALRVDRLPQTTMQRYHPYHVTRAELLRRLGRSDEARAAYEEALELVDNPASGPTSPAAPRRDWTETDQYVRRIVQKCAPHASAGLAWVRGLATPVAAGTRTDSAGGPDRSRCPPGMARRIRPRNDGCQPVGGRRPRPRRGRPPQCPVQPDALGRGQRE